MEDYISPGEVIRDLFINKKDEPPIEPVPMVETVPVVVEPVVKVVEAVKKPASVKKVSPVPQLPINTETPGWEHTVFKNVDGVFYAVSPRVINEGYVPQDGTTIATDLERFEFYRKMVERNGVPITNDNRFEAAERLVEKGLDPLFIKNLTGVDLGGPDG